MGMRVHRGVLAKLKGRMESWERVLKLVEVVVPVAEWLGVAACRAAGAMGGQGDGAKAT